MDNRVVASELKKIEDKTGRLTPGLVVKAAKNVKSPLHAQFTWDDSVAGHQWRLQQARNLINGVMVSFQTSEMSLRSVAYVRDPTADPGKQGYRSIVKLSQDEDEARDAVIAEFSRAAAHLRRARDVAVSLGHAREIEKLIVKVVGVGERVAAS